MNAVAVNFTWNNIKLMYDSLVLSHLQLWIMKNSKHNAETNPLFKDLDMLKVTNIFDVQYLKLWYQFIDNELPHFFQSMFIYNHKLYETKTHCHSRLHLCPTHTTGASSV